jgi:hypothetical protein
MKFKSYYIIIVLIFITQSIYSQKVVIGGYVNDKKTGEAIIGANIVARNANSTSSSNKFGYFTLSFSRNELIQLQISYIGYETRTLELRLKTDTIINIEINPTNKILNEVTVVASRKLEEKAEMGRMNIPLSTLKTLPSITGEPDILKAYQLLPGVQMGSENNNGLFVRGGSPDQNLFLLDDVSLYNVSHLGGFFSVFDPSMVKSVDLYKGGFPARYGGRISSVVDVRNKDGNLYQNKGEIALGLISSKIFLEGPIKKGESSYAISYRNCNFGIYSYLFNKLQGIDYTQGYYFYDINAKLNLKLSQKDRLFLGFYSGDDNIYYKEKDTKLESYNLSYSGESELKWGNTAGSIRWLHIFDNGIFNNTTLAYTNYHYNDYKSNSVEFLTDKSKNSESMTIRSGTNDFQINNDAEVPFEKLTLRFGFVAGTHSYIPGLVTYTNTSSTISSDSIISNPNQRMKAVDVYGYTEFDYKITEKLTTNAGFRTGIYNVSTTNFPIFEPRIVVNYLFLPSFSLKGSYSNMHQNIHLLTNSSGGLPSDIWVPSTKIIQPEESNQFSIGLAHTTKNDYEFSIEIYKKNIQNLIEYKQGALLINNSQNWDTKVETGGVGNVKGFELLIRKKSGLLTGWLGYTLSSNTRKFENLNNGREYPFTYDQTHNISLVGNYKITDNITLSASWVYHTGNCITLPTAKYLVYNDELNNSNKYKTVDIYAVKNGYRLPDYHRLDIGLNRTKQLKKGIRNWSINIYNAYNRQNAYYVYYAKNKDGNIKLYQRSFFPFILNLGYSYVW